MADIPRISPSEARQHMSSGALLVCGYDDPELFKQNHLEGALSLQEFQARAASLPRDREVVFYCA